MWQYYDILTSIAIDPNEWLFQAFAHVDDCFKYFLGIRVMWDKRFLFVINANCFLMLTLPQWKVKTYNKMYVGFKVTMEWGVGKFERSNISFFWKVFTPQNPSSTLVSLKGIMFFIIRNQWLDVLNNHIIDCNHKILLQILCGKFCSHIFIVHLISK
jgi:hypothetical protein